MTRTLEIAAIDASGCVRCPLATGRTQVVYGSGDPNADLLFVGEAPGRDEDLQGEPFVGRAGQLLTSVIEDAGLRRADVYIANVLKCRPPNNRDPLPLEIESCRPWLLEQLDLVDPLLVVTLGNFATKLLLDTTVGISRLHGKTYRFGERWLIPTFHPSAALRGGPNGQTVRDLRADLAFAAETMTKLRQARSEPLATPLENVGAEGRLF